eukprot:TRINITY_DN2606_c0_g1_i1.p1 TRINITY_DN2606_c0_g1~~TRINITY_DN2606_c0_g1_i1.p1  ORF type:complete len:640 (-),score=196.52 TRINITY_DN2606_c0_g1_i1:24-1943(-)
MLDKVVVFSKSGIILWSTQQSDKLLEPDPTNRFISEVLLSQKSTSEAKLITDFYILRWTYDNELDIVFLQFYPKNFEASYSTNLVGFLESLKSSFLDSFGSYLKSAKASRYYDEEVPNRLKKFDQEYAKLQVQLGTDHIEKTKQVKQRSFKETAKGKDREEREQEKERAGTSTISKKKKDEKKKLEEEKLRKEQEEKESKASPQQKPDEPLSQEAIEENKRRLAERRGPKPFQKKGSAANSPTPAVEGKKVKKMTKWDDDDLDAKPKRLPRPSSDDPEEEAKIQKMRNDMDVKGVSDPDNWDVVTKPDEQQDEDSDEEDNKTNTEVNKKNNGWLGGIWNNITNRTISKEDLTPVLANFRSMLIDKNVASEISDQIISTVEQHLLGQNIGTFSRVQSTVRSSLSQTLSTILSPSAAPPLLSEINHIKTTEDRPYVILFIGVNGVGKSTNLAKLAHFLLGQNLVPYIIASDTFRSGAVEQLKTHARCLNIELYEEGYERDPAIVARNGIERARKNKKDVVLIDSAGRMQNKSGLMRGLAKLVYGTKPDLILFVGEALVGNEAVEQMRGFSKALEEYREQGEEVRKIDGIVLSKFDTVDEKVGAAITLAHVTGTPIMFVGTGQKYPDLKRMHTEPIVKALLG